MSRWGNFISGIESGLDKILADDASEASHTRVATNEGKIQSAAQLNVSRHGSGRRNTSRLQERLAKAVDGIPSASPRASVDSQEARPESSDKPDSLHVANTATNLPAPAKSSVDNALPDPKASDQLLLNPGTQEEVGEVVNGPGQPNDEILNEDVLLERIEVLQTKLAVLIKEATTKAGDLIGTSEKGAHTRQLAEKDEKIALLMAEGQALSVKELKNLSTIRRLHTRLVEADTLLTNEKKKSTELSREANTLKLRLRDYENLKAVPVSDAGREQLQAQLTRVQRQIGSYQAEIDGLRQELESSSRESQERFDKQKQQSESDHRQITYLQDEIQTAKIERELGLERHRAQMAEQRGKVTDEQSKLAAKEAELRAEIKSLESRLEAMRTRNEEAVGSPIEGQAKQLRQIEALQRQHLVSKENWNGIQASLNARVSTLENERNDLSRREGDLRKKLRDSVSALRTREEELDNSKSDCASLEENLLNERNLVKDLRTSLNKARSDCNQLRQELRAAQETRSKSSDGFIGDSQPMSSPIPSPLDRPASPFAPRKLPIPPSDSYESRPVNAFGLFIPAGTAPKRPSSSRKISAASPHLPSQPSQRHQSITSLTRSSSRSALRDSHSISLDGEEQDRIEDMRTPTTPGQGFDEILTASASTPAAGPSVQMVERMTSAVRRLESEKAAARDEFERMLMERDEARRQIVSLLEEAESKRSLEKRVVELEAEITKTNGRYRTTLELLGEKTETVEELKADIADMKQIYREALEKTIK